MKIGIMYDFRAPSFGEGSWAEVASWTLESCEQLDGAGVSGLWLTEHHFTPDGYLPTLLTAASAVAMRTKRATIGTSVLLAPLHHPITLAEQAAVVDNLSEGRLILGMGLGYRESELATFGVDRKQRRARMEETLEILVSSWSDDPVRHDGDAGTVPAVSVTPKPFQRPHPPIWIGGRSVAAAQRAGRWGTGFIWVGDTGVRDAFLEAAGSVGKRREQLTVARLRSFVDADIADTDRGTRIARGLEYRAENYARWYGDAGDLEGDDRLQSAGTAAQQAIRHLEEEVRQLDDLQAQGVDYVIYHGTPPGVDPRALLPQWEELISAVG